LTAGTDHVIGEVETLAQLDAKLAPALELLNGAGVQLREAARGLRSYRDGLDLDPERLAAVEDRLGVVHDLARKHRIDPAQLPALTARLSTELEQLEHADVRLDELRSALAAAADAYRAAAKSLSASRRKVAKKLAQEVSRGIQDLGMKGGVFEIRVEDVETDEYSVHGTDRVEFLVTANPGQPLRPLNKVASGGELSRISLAIEVATAQTTGIPTLVFDEVDAGVGGGVAEIVGRRLKALAQRRQILCVTHLPQVAAQGQQHWAVSKRSSNGSTRSSIAPLEENERIEEVARMLGGVTVTAQTRAHAQEMLHHARVS
jgi:DNA repair protein RecN (Recombination protein N)